MPHQNVSSSDATAQNAATDRTQADARGRDQDTAARAEPRSYTARDSADASLAPPAAGEVADLDAEGEDLDGVSVQQGRTNANRPEKTEAQRGQGPKTIEANRERLKGGG